MPRPIIQRMAPDRRGCSTLMTVGDGLDEPPPIGQAAVAGGLAYLVASLAGLKNSAKWVGLAVGGLAIVSSGT